MKPKLTIKNVAIFLGSAFVIGAGTQLLGLSHEINAPLVCVPLILIEFLGDKNKPIKTTNNPIVQSWVDKTISRWTAQ